MRRNIFSLVPLIFAITTNSCNLEEKAKQKSDNYSVQRGVNISHWLSQSNRRGEERRNFFLQKDMEFIASIGYDHIRLPVDEEQLWDEQGSKDEEAFKLLHNALEWAQEENLKVIIDLHIIRSHHFNKQERPLWTDPAEQEKFIGLWCDLSEELHLYPVDFVAYEIMNEAVADDPDDWNKLIARTMKALRELEPERKIVIGSNMWQQVQTFKNLKIPEDDQNIILSYHFYLPFPVTHYKASWTGIAGYEGPVHYPGEVIEKDDLEGLPEDLVEELSHHMGVFTKDTLEKLIMLPVKYAEEYGLPLYCGEWGCLPTVPREIRMRWYTDVRNIMESHDIAWANWDYKGGFGIIDSETGEPDEKFIEVLLK